MAAPAHRSAADLFDNSAFSDVTILQFDDNEELHEYRAHKAILCMESGFFHRAFTGIYQDKDDIKVKGDGKLHFELLLKYIYTNHYDTAEIAKLAANDEAQRVLIPMGICVVADKYEVPTIYRSASNDVRALLLASSAGNLKVLEAAIVAHYGEKLNVDHPMGKLIVSVVLSGQRNFTNSARYKGMLKSHPAFAVDMALALACDTINEHCYTCSTELTVRSDMQERKEVTKFWCNFCGSKKNHPPQGMRQ